VDRPSKLSEEIEFMEMRVEKGRATEDRFTGAIESQTSQIPSSGYLAAAVASMGASALFENSRER
jgi:hypothetical protein